MKDDDEGDGEGSDGNVMKVVLAAEWFWWQTDRHLWMLSCFCGQKFKNV